MPNPNKLIFQVSATNDRLKKLMGTKEILPVNSFQTTFTGKMAKKLPFNKTKDGTIKKKK